MRLSVVLPLLVQVSGRLSGQTARRGQGDGGDAPPLPEVFVENEEVSTTSLTGSTVMAMSTSIMAPGTTTSGDMLGSPVTQATTASTTMDPGTDPPVSDPPLATLPALPGEQTKPPTDPVTAPPLPTAPAESSTKPPLNSTEVPPLATLPVSEQTKPPTDPVTAPPLPTAPPPDSGTEPPLAVLPETPANSTDPATASPLPTLPASTTMAPVDLPEGPPPDLAALFQPPAPPGDLRPCNQVISMDYPSDIIPQPVILQYLYAFVDTLYPDGGTDADTAKSFMDALALYGVRATKVCTTCEEALAIYEARGGSAPDGMPWCQPGTFAAGRSITGLLLEPISPLTNQPPVGKLAAAIWSAITYPDPFFTASQIWPKNLTMHVDGFANGALASAASGVYSFLPDVLGYGDDWENPRSYIVKSYYQASSIPLMLKVQDNLQNAGNCTVLDNRVATMGYSEGGYGAVSIADALDKMGGYNLTYVGAGGTPFKISTELMFEFVVTVSQGTYPAPYLFARFGAAYSSDNPDLANSGVDQNIISDEYLDPTNPAKNINDWITYGVGYETMFGLLPRPPANNLTDFANPDLIELVTKSFEAGIDSPCTSEFVTDSTAKMCQALIDNDITSIAESATYPITICHSQNDTTISPVNIPNTSANPYLIMIGDLPQVGSFLQPTKDHFESASTCMFGFIFPFIEPPDTSGVRPILPVDDSCYPDLSPAPSASPVMTPASPMEPTIVTSTLAPSTAPIEDESTPSPTSGAFLSSVNVGLSIIVASFCLLVGNW